MFHLVSKKAFKSSNNVVFKLRSRSSIKSLLHYLHFYYGLSFTRPLVMSWIYWKRAPEESLGG